MAEMWHSGAHFRAYNWMLLVTPFSTRLQPAAIVVLDYLCSAGVANAMLNFASQRNVTSPAMHCNDHRVCIF